MGKFKEFRKRIAASLVTYYYNRAYVKAVKEADKRHEEEGEMIYVIDHYVRGRLLSTINRRQFRKIKLSATKLHKNPMFASPSYNTDMLKRQAWYHTADRSQKNGLTETDKEIRRLALIRDGLKKARLY